MKKSPEEKFDSFLDEFGSILTTIRLLLADRPDVYNLVVRRWDEFITYYDSDMSELSSRHLVAAEICKAKELLNIYSKGPLGIFIKKVGSPTWENRGYSSYDLRHSEYLYLREKFPDKCGDLQSSIKAPASFFLETFTNILSNERCT